MLNPEQLRELEEFVRADGQVWPGSDVNLPHDRELTYEERATWGVCPVCGAVAGKRCNPMVGIRLAFGGVGGTHLGRLDAAPRFMKVTFH